MQLNYKFYPATHKKNHCIVILHGLLGSKDNWRSVAKHLQSNHDIYCFDLANHGDSQFCDSFNYKSLAQDVKQTIDHLELSNFVCLGHSMGGKVAMQFCHDNPDQVSHLIVVDIAPKLYSNRHKDIFEGLRQCPLNNIDRKGIDQRLARYIPQDGIRQFILKSLSKAEQQKQWRWLFNWPVLSEQYEQIAQPPALTKKITTRTLFIKGELSDYLQAEDHTLIQQHFSQVNARLILGAGHWPHVEKQATFIKELIRFIS